MKAKMILENLEVTEQNWMHKTEYAQIDEPRMALVDLSNAIYSGEITENETLEVLAKINGLLNKHLEKQFKTV